MPDWVCYQGGCCNLALEGAECVVLPGALGGDWFCARAAEGQPPGDVAQLVVELARVQALARKHGFRVAGTRALVLTANAAHELARAMVLATYPRPAESQRRLRRAGWPVLGERFEGDRVAVAAGNGRDVVEAAGENAAEAWHRAAQKALGEGG